MYLFELLGRTYTYSWYRVLGSRIKEFEVQLSRSNATSRGFERHREKYRLRASEIGGSARRGSGHDTVN